MKKLFYSFIFAFALFISLTVEDRAEASVLGTFIIKPKSPTITTAYNSSKFTVTLKWKKVTGAKKYEIYYAHSGSNYYYKFDTTKSTSKKLSYFSRGNTYKFKIRAVYNSDIYNESQVKTVKITK